MANPILQPYKVNYNGVIHEFKELCMAFKFCDEHKLLYPPRFWEKEPSDFIKNIFPFSYDVRNNRERLEKESIVHQLETRLKESTPSHEHSFKKIMGIPQVWMCDCGHSKLSS